MVSEVIDIDSEWRAFVYRSRLVGLQNYSYIIVKSTLDGAKNKTKIIVLMHDAATKITTVEALPEIIEGLIK